MCLGVVDLVGMMVDFGYGFSGCGDGGGSFLLCLGVVVDFGYGFGGYSGGRGGFWLGFG